MSDNPTQDQRAAVAAALVGAMYGDADRISALADAAIAAMLVHPDQWLLDLVQRTHLFCSSPAAKHLYGGCIPRCAAVPASVRRAAGINQGDEP